jgi:flagellar hook assembly protein FlgD
MEKHREEIPSVVDSYRLVQNYPNPFNGATVISYALEEECDLTLAIYNLLGQRVRLLKQGRFHRGFFQVRWDATDDGGRDVGAGIYLLRMETAAFSATRKMIYLR